MEATLSARTHAPPLDDLEAAQRALFASTTLAVGSRTVRWSGGETQVMHAGAGPPLLFVHGGFGQSTEWLPLWPHLATRFSLFAVDRPGHGLADPFGFAGVDIRALAVRFLAEVQDALGLGAVSLVGNSMGGLWGMQLALREPDRVLRLVLVGAPAGMRARLPLPLLALRWPLTSRVASHMFRRSEPDGVRSFFGRLLVANPGRLSTELLIATAAGQRRNVASLMSFARRVIGYRCIHRDLRIDDAEWQQLRAPVHFIWGDRDAFDAPASARRVVDRIGERPSLTIVPGAGHLPWLDAPDAVAEAIAAAASG